MYERKHNDIEFRTNNYVEIWKSRGVTIGIARQGDEKGIMDMMEQSNDIVNRDE